ncbi:putative mitochondrial protein [Vitis vinifera]|uniref:Putative mitochondrial protein n=1 Tax=Vitis vinifera TaxID=29760 RepID=A0A438CQP7_VITVI|nr:putative mitochondrial protein [Vitis vinifera]
MQLSRLATWTLELNIFYMCKKPINPEEKEGPKEEETQEAVKEEASKLIRKPLPTELKYAYLEENKKCHVVISSITTPQEECLLEVLRRYKKAGIIYPISDSPWMSPTQVVPKKSGITVVQNDKGEEVATRLTLATPGYFQIEIDVEHQENTTVTCPFGTLYLQRDVFWFMLQHSNDELSLATSSPRKGIEVDKAKVELIIKLPSPTTVKGVRQFLGHAGFHKSKMPKARLIKWILLLQEFNLQIKDKKGVENVVANHLSSLAIMHNSHVTGEVPSEWKAQDRKHFFAKIHAYYWEEHFLFKYCADQIIRKCVPKQEPQRILSHCHERACGGHFASQKIAMKLLQSSFSCPSLFKDAHTMCRSYDRCQRLGKLTRRNQMPMNPILIVDLFDVWGIDFMGPFPMSFRTHFCNKPFETLLAKYGVKYKVVTPYHPQTSRQVDLANRGNQEYIDEGGEHEQKRLAHLPVEVEYKAWWAIKKVNMDLNKAGMKRCLNLNEMEELRNEAYINSKIAKQRIKRWLDQLISKKEFQKGQRVLLYDSRLHIFLGKLKSRWIGPFIIHQVHSNGVVELLNSNSTDTFKVNGHRLKPFMEPFNQDKKERSQCP